MALSVLVGKMGAGSVAAHQAVQISTRVVSRMNGTRRQRNPCVLGIIGRSETVSWGRHNPLNPAPAVRLSRPRGVWQLAAFVRLMRPGVSKQDCQGFPFGPRRTCRWWRKFRQLLRHFVLLCTLICLLAEQLGEKHKLLPNRRVKCQWQTSG